MSFIIIQYDSGLIHVLPAITRLLRSISTVQLSYIKREESCPTIFQPPLDVHLQTWSSSARSRYCVYWNELTALLLQNKFHKKTLTCAPQDRYTDQPGIFVFLLCCSQRLVYLICIEPRSSTLPTNQFKNIALFLFSTSTSRFLSTASVVTSTGKHNHPPSISFRLSYVSVHPSNHRRKKQILLLLNMLWPSILSQLQPERHDVFDV